MALLVALGAAEDILRAVKQPCLPRLYLARMNVELFGQLGHCLVAFEGRQGHTRLEGGAVILSFSSHGLHRVAWNGSIVTLGAENLPHVSLVTVRLMGSTSCLCQEPKGLDWKRQDGANLPMATGRPQNGEAYRGLVGSSL